MKLKKWLLMMAIVTVAAASSVPIVYAGAPYEAYTYNFYRDAVPLPAPFLPDRSVSGNDLGVGSFKNPNDMYVTEDGFIYILDSGNNRIVVTDEQWNVVRTITAFNNNGKEDAFNNPGGLFVTLNKQIYVADTDNGRIIVLTNEGEFVKTIEKPQSEILPANFKFAPVKLTVDKAGRVFVVARGVFEGLMQFDDKGLFLGYVGTINVTSNFADQLWRRIATDAQRSQMQLFIPTEFSSVDIDHKGFVYSTNIDKFTQTPIKRLNPSGQDVIKRFGYYPNMGDVRFRQFGNNAGPSKLTDIKVIGGGMYTVLDSYRGRLFTYNDEGELLYAFGGKGTQLGLFNTPVAVERIGEKLAVLDRGRGNVVVYRPTLFGKAVHNAVTLHYNGNDDEAVKVWKEVLRLNSNYDIAYLGIGRSLLMEKKNKEAIEYFELGMQRKYYSVAFKRYRREVMQEHFGTFMSTLTVLAVALVAFLIAKKWRMRGTANREA
ncbi:NHL repeat-containing protein [Paenibacillus thermotolerans]|uniref:NHL repeat-containing protein n=1 Tax=Paenibacillus thermotolerans TaxID=3027807 RepID=UPI002368B33A|nr:MULTISPECIES: NHL repeat-containing protein [unclassified Paenibacillus]